MSSTSWSVRRPPKYIKKYSSSFLKKAPESHKLVEIAPYSQVKASQCVTLYSTTVSLSAHRGFCLSSFF